MRLTNNRQYLQENLGQLAGDRAAAGGISLGEKISQSDTVGISVGGSAATSEDRYVLHKA